MQSVSISKKFIIFALAATLSGSGLFAMDTGGGHGGARPQQDSVLNALNSVMTLYARANVACEAIKPLASVVANRVLGRPCMVENKWWSQKENEGRLDYVGRMLGNTQLLFSATLLGGRQIARMANNAKEEVCGRDYVGIIKSHIQNVKDKKAEQTDKEIWYDASLGSIQVRAEVEKELEVLDKDLKALEKSSSKSKAQKIGMKYHSDKLQESYLIQQNKKGQSSDPSISTIGELPVPSNAKKFELAQARFRIYEALFRDGVERKFSPERNKKGLLRRIAGSLFN